MPRYTYHCYQCECTINAWHGIKETKTKCTACGSEGLVRVPSNFTISKKQKNNKKQKVGEVVKSSIEQFREDLEEEKENLKNQEYEKK
jgi:putative FmdB family regulatory protein